MKAMQRIFVIDADCSLRAMLTEALEDEGYIVEGARDGKTLFSHSEIAKFSCNLLIIDVLMHGNVDCQWLYDLRRRAPHLPIIAISDFLSEPGLKNDLMALGITDLFSKPFDLNTMLLSIEQILKRQEDISQGELASALRMQVIRNMHQKTQYGQIAL